MRREDTHERKREVKCATSEGTSVVLLLAEKTKEKMNMDIVDEETTRMIERLVVVRISTKHINLWMRQLEIKRKGDNGAGWVDGA